MRVRYALLGLVLGTTLSVLPALADDGRPVDNVKPVIDDVAPVADDVRPAANSARPAVDDVRPVQVQIREREPGSFLVQWSVPQVIPLGAILVPVLPSHCEPEGEGVVIERSGNWVARQAFRCSEGISGYEVGIRFPVPNPSITTVIRVALLSGERQDANASKPPSLRGSTSRTSVTSTASTRARALTHDVSPRFGGWRLTIDPRQQRRHRRNGRPSRLLDQGPIANSPGGRTSSSIADEAEPHIPPCDKDQP